MRLIVYISVFKLTSDVEGQKVIRKNTTYHICDSCASTVLRVPRPNGSRLPIAAIYKTRHISATECDHDDCENCCQSCHKAKTSVYEHLPVPPTPFSSCELVFRAGMDTTCVSRQGCETCGTLVRSSVIFFEHVFTLIRDRHMDRS